MHSRSYSVHLQQIWHLHPGSSSFALASGGEPIFPLSLLTLQNPSTDASPVGERINYAQWSWEVIFAFAHCCWSQSKCKKNAAYEIGMSKDEAQVDLHSDPHRIRMDLLSVSAYAIMLDPDHLNIHLFAAVAVTVPFT
jgi:hypothetical protein